MRTRQEIAWAAFQTGPGGVIKLTAEEMAEFRRKPPEHDVILRCRSCGVSWESGKPERHIMGCEQIKQSPGESN